MFVDPRSPQEHWDDEVFHNDEIRFRAFQSSFHRHQQLRYTQNAETLTFGSRYPELIQ
jgi:hypothetical protein